MGKPAGFSLCLYEAPIYVETSSVHKYRYSMPSIVAVLLGTEPLIPFTSMAMAMAVSVGRLFVPQARIFREIFMPVELSPVEFMQLMDLSQRRVVLAGNDINQHGRPHKEMFLIVEGTAEVGAV